MLIKIKAVKTRHILGYYFLIKHKHMDMVMEFFGFGPKINDFRFEERRADVNKTLHITGGEGICSDNYFVVEETMGVGGFAPTLKCLCLGDGIRYAVKVVPCKTYK